jgi:mxaA protein
VIRLLTVLLVLTTPLAAQDKTSPILSVSTIEPRGFGYFVGDLLTREIVVTVAAPYTLEAASQPSPRRLSYWLDLRAVNVDERAEGGRTRYRLKLVYQTLYVPLSPEPRTLPAITLRFIDGGDTVAAKVPPFNIVMAPLREVIPEKPEEGPVGYLRPDEVPRTVSSRQARIGFGAGLVIVALAFGLLAYHNAWWPFGKRPARPFTKAARALRRLSRAAPDTNAYRTGLLDLHRAFDAAAGRRVLAEDVPDFLSEHGEFRPYEAEIGRFFATSRRAFFANDHAGAAATMPLPAVAELGAELGVAERRAT